jgi:hypothetical protein
MTDTAYEERNMEPFVFIVGRGRSGTTLIRAMLTSNTELAIPNETHFVVPLSRDRRIVDEKGNVNVDAFLAKIKRQPGFHNMELDHDKVAALFHEAKPVSYPDAVRLLFSIYADKEGKPRYGDKTPIHVLHVEYLAEMFPEARFIHLIRDGRNVTLSNLELNWGPESVWEGAVYWKRFVNEGRRAGAKLGPGRYLELRYEDLLEDPERHVRAMCDFVNLSFDPVMLRYFERTEKISGAKESHHQNLSRPPTKGLRDWRQQMSRRDVELFEVLAGDLLSEMGYERVTDGSSLSARANASVKWMGVQSRRASRSVRKRTRRARKSLQSVQ